MLAHFMSFVNSDCGIRVPVLTFLHFFSVIALRTYETIEGDMPCLLASTHPKTACSSKPNASSTRKNCAAGWPPTRPTPPCGPELTVTISVCAATSWRLPMTTATTPCGTWMCCAKKTTSSPIPGEPWLHRAPQRATYPRCPGGSESPDGWVSAKTPPTVPCLRDSRRHTSCVAVYKK